jgi:hypothetical protein
MIVTLMEFVPKENLSVQQRVVPIKGSSPEFAKFLMVARDDLVELIEV